MYYKRRTHISAVWIPPAREDYLQAEVKRFLGYVDYSIGPDGTFTIRQGDGSLSARPGQYIVNATPRSGLFVMDGPLFDSLFECDE